MWLKKKKDDGSFYNNIEKPQTYFNEAKLTAIALSIRFALLDLVTAPNGRFMALDDMLISLDMSNRMKVVNYLFDVIGDKYKIYLFTHDRLFFSTIKKRIAIEKKGTDWLVGGLYTHDVDENNDYQPCSPYPKFIEDKDKTLEIMEYYAKHDYPICGQLLRKWCEEIFESLYPDTFKKCISSSPSCTIDTNLNDRINALEVFCQKESLDYSQFKNLKIYKDNLLNTVSHYDIESPIYKEEILLILQVLNKLQSIIDNKKNVGVNHDIGLELVKPDGTRVTVCVRIKSKKSIPLLLINGSYRVSYFIECSVKKEIVASIPKELPDEVCYHSIYDAYKDYCDKYGIVCGNDLLDVIYDHGKSLKSMI